ncbi:hypothetical protein [Lentibacillus sp. Marseille-P4043]|uniref:hypothetical protein n=1 Tax=Lentibacillus sp. Marseille-P4043 TaxID=2040293 RepID=UPI00131A5203|nr:hypothetical protein [Lentibacillus sp. Marseille-P4043]
MNMGHLFSEKGDSEQSIHYYNKSLEYFTLDCDKALTLLGLTKEYFKNNDFVSAYKGATTGLSLLEHHDDIDSLDTRLELSAYKYRLNEQYDEMEYFIKNELLPILSQRNNYVKIARYSEILSKYYSEKKMYKKALWFERKISLAYKEMADI